MQEKAKARLGELAPAARGRQEAGFTQPTIRLFLHVCTSFSAQVFTTGADTFDADTFALNSYFSHWKA